MPLPSSGAISLLDIANEFGGSTPHGIDEYTSQLVNESTTYTAGLVYEVRNQSNSLNPTNASDFNAKFTGTPNSTGFFTQTINWGSSSNGSGGTNRPPNLPNARFSWQVEGVIYAATSGLYRFVTQSDDGNQLTINGTIITSFYGGRGLNDSSENGSITLSAGYHSFRYRMQQGSGANGGIVKWRPPTSSSDSVIPASVFFRETVTTAPQSAPYSFADFYGLSIIVPDGNSVYTSPGTYTWTCPTGVTSVCVVCVGAGGGGGASASRCGGSGGGLAWRNDISVTAGTSYTVVVGSGGGNNAAGGDSYFSSTSTVRGSGGLGGGTGTTQAGGAFNQGGGSDGGGGIGGGTTSRSRNAHGGGGAGGYSGAGGDAVNNSDGEAGLGGGGGAGADGGGAGGDRGGGGGGTGIYGQGSNGAGGVYSDGGGGGGSTASSTGTAGQTDGNGGDGGFPGGGGGQRSTGSPGSGGNGAVRILWGSNRAFPSTNVS